MQTKTKKLTNKYYSIMTQKNFKRILWVALGALYFPIYLLSWVLHKIARILLAIAYFGLLDKTKGVNILKYLLNYGGRV